MHVIIAGCGRVGAQLAQYLALEGHNVVVIDRNPASFSRLGVTFNGVTLTGIAFDEKLLEEAGISRADAFAAVTNFDNTNLMAAEIVSRIYKVPKVIARLYNPDKRHTFNELGIDYVCGTALVAEHVKEKLLGGYLILLHERADVGIQIVEFAVNEKAEGKAAGGLSGGEAAKLLAIVRDRKGLQWTDDTPLLAGDRVVMALKRQGWAALMGLVDRKSIL
jgi:trk system potassium uptake protein TrkA